MKDFIRASWRQAKPLLVRRESVQVASLYTSMMLGMALGFVVSVINTSFLGPQGYGDFRFILNLFTFANTLSTFGFFWTGAKLLATEKELRSARETIAVLLIVAIAISILVSGVFILLSYVKPESFQHLSKMVRIVSLFFVVFPLKMCLENVMQGQNRIVTLTFFQRAPQCLYILGAVTAGLVTRFGLGISLALYFCAEILAILLASLLVKPAIGHLGSKVRQLLAENKVYGFHVYLGSLANVATIHLMGLYLGYVVDTASLGFYHLATTVTAPLGFVPSAVGTTFFKAFAHRDSIPKKVAIGTFILSLGAILAFHVLIGTVVRLAYSAAFHDVIYLSRIVVFGKVFQGFGDMVNRFLGAHGRGRELRNGTFAVGTVIVACTLILVPWLGALGAAITETAAGILYCCAMLYYYQVSRRSWK